MVGIDWNAEVKSPKEQQVNGEDFNIKTTDTLIVDSHEPQKIMRLLKRTGIEYKIETLSVGDFVRGTVCVERKDIIDFIQSKRSKHLDKQLMQMEEKYSQSFLIISGSFKDVHFNPNIRGWTVNHHMGALASIAVRYPRVKIIQVDNDTQLVNVMLRIMEKAHDGKMPTLYDTELMRNKMTDEDIKVKMLSCIPKVGLKKAKELGDIINITLLYKPTGEPLTKNHLEKIKGVGKVLSDKILSINKK